MIDTINAEVEQAIAEYSDVLRQEPTAEEAIKQQRNISQVIASITDRFCHSNKPRKPNAPKGDGGDLSKAFYQYAEALAKWEESVAEWKVGNTGRSAAIAKTENACKAYLEKLSGVNNLPPEQSAKVKALAWERGHSSGFSEYYSELMDLMEIFNA